MRKLLIRLGHILAIGLIFTGIATGYSFFIPLGIIAELALWTYAIFFFSESGRRPMRKTRQKQTRDGMIDLQGFKGKNKEQE